MIGSTRNVGRIYEKFESGRFAMVLDHTDGNAMNQHAGGLEKF